MPNAEEHAEIVAEVAHLYFEKAFDQRAIADRLKVSRSSVSRLLAQARRSGIVEIRIRYPSPVSEDLAQQLRDKFQLQESRVLKTAATSQENIPARVGLLASKYLEEVLRDGDILAMSWGATLFEVVHSIQPKRRFNVQVVQMVGAIGAASSEWNGANLVRALAQNLGGRYFTLNAPLIVENAETQRALLLEPSIRDVLDLARHASIALVGVGAVAQGVSSPLRARMLSSSDIRIIHKHVGIGDICSQYFDVRGKPVAQEINRRVVALDLESLKAIPKVIGVATGVHKAKAILGALRGGYINSLVTDDLTASRVLKVGAK